MERRGGGGRELSATWADCPRHARRAPSSVVRASLVSWATKSPAADRAHSASAPMARQASATRRPTASWSVMARGRAW